MHRVFPRMTHLTALRSMGYRTRFLVGTLLCLLTLTLQLMLPLGHTLHVAVAHPGMSRPFPMWHHPIDSERLSALRIRANASLLSAGHDPMHCFLCHSRLYTGAPLVAHSSTTAVIQASARPRLTATQYPRQIPGSISIPRAPPHLA